MTYEESKAFWTIILAEYSFRYIREASVFLYDLNTRREAPGYYNGI